MSRGATERTPSLRPVAGGQPPGPLLTIQQAAERLQLSEKTIRRRIRDGSLRAHKLGAVWRLASHDIDEFVRLGRHVP